MGVIYVNTTGEVGETVASTLSDFDPTITVAVGPTRIYEAAALACQPEEVTIDEGIKYGPQPNTGKGKRRKW